MATPDLAARITEAQAYADSIRNTAKRLYAYRYLHQTVLNGLGEPHPGSLSYMAAQSVRLRIQAIMRGEEDATS